MVEDTLKIPNPSALDMGEMFGISLERMDTISKGLDEMVAKINKPTMIYASSVIRYIERLCNTKEEFTWALCNHIMWMARTNRYPTTSEVQNAMIDKFGQPENL